MKYSESNEPEKHRLARVCDVDLPVRATPYLVALLVVDQVIIDKETAKKTLVGVFDRLLCPAFPTSQALGLYARVADAEGDYRFTIQFVRVETDQILGEAQSSPRTISNRLETFEIVLRLVVGIPGPGIYEFRLFADHVYLGHAELNVLALTVIEPGG